MENIDQESNSQVKQEAQSVQKIRNDENGELVTVTKREDGQTNGHDQNGDSKPVATPIVKMEKPSKPVMAYPSFVKQFLKEARDAG